MADSNKYLDELFEKARKEPPLASFEEVGTRFTQSVAVGSSGAVLAVITKLKVFIISLSCLAALTVATFVWLNKNGSTQTKNAEISDLVETENTVENNLSREKLTKDTAILEERKEPLPADSTTVFSSEKEKIQQSAHDNTNHQSQSDTSFRREAAKLSLLPTKPQEDRVDKVSMSNRKSVDIPFVVPSPPQQTPVKFTVTESTSTEELSRISAQAQRAGINYTYVRDLKKKLIREFNVDMYLDENKVACTVQVCVPKGGTFQISFGWYVNDKGKAVAFMDDVYQVEAEQKYPLRITITRNMNKLYYEKGVTYIEQNFDDLIKNADPKGPDDYILNRAGYVFLKQNDLKEAIDLFELNVRLFPNKANPWDSLGEAYYKKGDNESALKAFQKALSIDPKLTSSINWIKKIRSENK